MCVSVCGRGAHFSSRFRNLMRLRGVQEERGLVRFWVSAHRPTIGGHGAANVGHAVATGPPRRTEHGTKGWFDSRAPATTFAPDAAHTQDDEIICFSIGTQSKGKFSAAHGCVCVFKPTDIARIPSERR